MIWKILITIIVADVIAQIIKIFTHKKISGRLDFRILLSDGGMPSGHSATVSALTTSIFLNDGFSLLFLVTLFFSIIVLRDATGIRRSAGRQAEVLNQIIRREKIQVKKLKELLGHTPYQALAGVILGMIIALISFYLF